jgi:hypothetical protein
MQCTPQPSGELAAGWLQRLASSPVTTATTPGRAAAMEASTRLIWAWEKGLRRIAQWSMPGRTTSSMNSVRPVSSAPSSVRLTRRPTQRGALVGRSSSRLGISTDTLPRSSSPALSLSDHPG